MNIIGKKEIDEALRTLKKYKSAKTNLENRIIDNEQWFKMRHNESMRTNGEQTPASAWLFNSIANKHADAMDNYPEVICLPREESDTPAAKALTSILPVIFERCGFEKIYSDAWWYKLKAGTACYGVFWNPRKCGGLGDIEIRQTDILNLFWESGIKNLEDSSNVFHVELFDNALLKQQYPALEGKLAGSAVEVARYIYDDSVDTSDKSAVIDWYYKRRPAGREIVHYCKFCNGTVLYASENDPQYMLTGFYSHGRYPFVLDPLFIEEGTPCGFGYTDIMKDAQKQIDALGAAITKNAGMAANIRYFINSAGSVNEEEFADWSNSFVHVNGSNLGEDSLRQIHISTLPEVYMRVLEGKIDELKETSGNRDFSQGSTSGGVTAASAIAALQEAGGKLTRDMVRGGYRAFTAVNELAIELIRQFYTEPRAFRIVGPGGEDNYISYDNALLAARGQGEAFGVNMGNRVPVFDIKVRAQKATAFTRLSQNELALQMYTAGMFNPVMREQSLIAVDMMDFEGKSAVLERISALKPPAITVPGGDAG